MKNDYFEVDAVDGYGNFKFQDENGESDWWYQLILDLVGKSLKWTMPFH